MLSTEKNETQENAEGPDEGDTKRGATLAFGSLLLKALDQCLDY
jgi:hypothetical protein